MENRRIYIILFLLSLITYSCFNKAGENVFQYVPVISLTEDFNELIEIKEWFAIGPFNFNPDKQLPQTTFFNEDLRKWKIDENIFKESDLFNLMKRKAPCNLISGKSAQVRLFNYAGENIDDKTNYYLCCVINCEAETEATLIADGSNSYNIWFNQELMDNVTGKHNINKTGDRFLNISLKRGRNFLVAKINRAGNIKSWDFNLAISPVHRAKQIFSVNYLSDFIINPLAIDTLRIYTGPYKSADIMVYNNSNELIYKEEFPQIINSEIAISSEEIRLAGEGFYKCNLKLDSITLEEHFYKGDYFKLIDELNSMALSVTANENIINDIDAGFKRLLYLSDQEVNDNSESEIRSLNRNRVFWAKSLYDLVSETLQNNNADKQAGTYIKTYMSPDKDSIFHFVFHANKETLNKTYMPLIIVVPYNLDGESMIYDWYLKNLDQIVIDNKMADEYGFAMAWVYMKGKYYSGSSAQEDVNNVINRIRVDYPVDMTKIFVMGDCEGGRRALLLAGDNPGIFSGMAVTSPLISGSSDFNSPLGVLKNLATTPVIIRHGINDEVSPVDNSRTLVSEAMKYGLCPVYIETNNSHLTFEKDYRRYAFEFFYSIYKQQLEY